MSPTPGTTEALRPHKQEKPPVLFQRAPPQQGCSSLIHFAHQPVTGSQNDDQQGYGKRRTNHLLFRHQFQTAGPTASLGLLSKLESSAVAFLFELYPQSILDHCYFLRRLRQALEQEVVPYRARTVSLSRVTVRISEGMPSPKPKCPATHETAFPHNLEPRCGYSSRPGQYQGIGGCPSSTKLHQKYLMDSDPWEGLHPRIPSMAFLHD
mmetsp:Transcript_21215/g.50438  ORF Transcript_21215/g.50438 Transcript_21215/m.50438 type:complete len:209 (+) Transcript_21215:1165-1791(+)